MESSSRGVDQSEGWPAELLSISKGKVNWHDPHPDRVALVSRQLRYIYCLQTGADSGVRTGDSLFLTWTDARREPDDQEGRAPPRVRRC